MADVQPLFIRGTLVHTPQRGQVTLLEDRIVAVVAGKIAAIAPGAEEAQCLAAHGGRAKAVLRLQPRQFLLPGFIDCHIHASQYCYAGTATDTPLMSWLHKYTFPTEARFARDPAFAADAYSKLVARLLAAGTTTALFFATLHQAPCRLLADLLEEAGMRAFVGKESDAWAGTVSMDRNAPESYVESTQDAVASAQAFVGYVRSKGLSRLQPALTPRFLPTCSPALLRALGELAAQHDVAVTSHIAESYDEAAFVRQLEGREGQEVSEVALFDAAALLTRQTVMAHGVLLSDAELAVMAQRGSAVAHCPLSNMFFADRILPVAELLRRGVKVGLGTDVAGGYDASMLGAMRHAVVASRALHVQRVAAAERPEQLALQFQRQPGGDPDVLSWRDALWLATAGGAQALGLESTIGTLEVGKEFDALLVDGGCRAAYDVFEQDSPIDQVEKFINCGDDRHIAQVWVQGRPVKQPLAEWRHAAEAAAAAAQPGCGAS